MALNIPSQLHRITVDIFTLEPSEREQLLEALKALEPGSSVKAYRQKVAETFPDASPRWTREATSLIFSITNLADTVGDAKAVAQDFVPALRKIDSESIKNAGEKSFDEFEKFVLEVANSQDSIGLRAKAARVRRQHERIFAFSEIFSDIRTIFTREGPKGRPGSAVIVHSLKIHSHRDGNHEELFFAMDYNDLLELKKVTERAIEKHKTLSSMVQDFGLRYIEFGGEE